MSWNSYKYTIAMAYIYASQIQECLICNIDCSIAFVRYKLFSSYVQPVLDAQAPSRNMHKHLQKL